MMTTVNPRRVWLVGAGGMAVSHAQVLVAQGHEVTVIGRGTASSAAMREQTGLPVAEGGLEAFLATGPALPDAAVVAVSIEQLAPVTLALLEAGVRRILLEKPGALTFAELQQVHDRATQRGAEVVIGYNRRTYASVLTARRMISEDGGPTSFHFEFTEWAHTIEPLVRSAGVKEAWAMANSSHVFDLAFLLGGLPQTLDAHVSGSLPWHPAGARFSGSGVSERGALFSYHADWDAPGRWGVEVLTTRRRFILRPLETLQVMHRGKVAVEPVPIEDTLDKDYKPGVYRLLEQFFTGEGEVPLCTLDEHLARWPVYARIAGYSL